MLKKVLTIVLICWFASLAQAADSDADHEMLVEPKAEAPRVPPHHFVDRENVALFGAITMSRLADVHSTYRNMRLGYPEAELPQALVNSRPGFVAFSLGMVGANVGAAYLFHRAGHHKLERATSYIHFAVITASAARNYAIP
ncbi:MAG TPA: hypothetical protein VEG30_15735 [Terriglobales bacterium]|nr:hypothetical protein [Terriglobales bacterium]